MVDCYGKSRSVIYAIIIHVLPMGFLMALFVGLRKKHQATRFFAGNFPYRYRETSRNFPASSTPPKKKGLVASTALLFAAFLQLRNCWWLRDVGFFHGFYSTSFEHPWNCVMPDVYLRVCHGRSKPRLLLQKVWSDPL